MADPAFDHKLDMNIRASGHIIAQDLHVDELVQQGLRSRFAPRGRYSWQEGAQGQFNKWLVHRYAPPTSGSPAANWPGLTRSGAPFVCSAALRVITDDVRWLPGRQP
jgi:hypothetical protein